MSPYRLWYSFLQNFDQRSFPLTHIKSSRSEYFIFPKLISLVLKVSNRVLPPYSTLSFKLNFDIRSFPLIYACKLPAIYITHYQKWSHWFFGILNRISYALPLFLYLIKDFSQRKDGFIEVCNLQRLLFGLFFF